MSDVVVIGAGPNGLAAAVALQKAGRDVVVVEQRDIVGGIAAPEEFHPGFTHAGIWHDDAVRPWVLSELGLSLTQRPRPPLTGPTGATTNAGHRAYLDTVAPFLRSILDAPAPDVGEEASLWPLLKTGLGLRRMGNAPMLELMRVVATSVDDFAAEHEPDVATQALICAEALPGTWMGPRSPMSTGVLLLREALHGTEVGAAAFVTALAAALGDRVRTGTAASSIRIESGRVAGVQLADGTAIDAPVVLSTIGPKRTFQQLVPPAALPDLIARDIFSIRTRGILAKLHLALSTPLDLPDRYCTAAHPMDLERSFDDAKHRRLPRRPVLEVRALPGNVASIWVHGAAHDLKGGWTDEARGALLDAALTSLEASVPDVRDRIEGHQLLVPTDFEDQLGLDGGHLLQGELMLDQVWSLRPLPMLARHDTPIEGLFLGGNGTHPGFGVTGAPGVLAARAIQRR